MTTPGQLLDLSTWKITLPIGKKNNPEEVQQPQLATFADPNWFHTNPAGDAVIFRAPVNGVTTSGSGYPRSELREMQAGGKEASWTGKSGTHTLTVVEAFTALPLEKPQLVGAQVHDAKKDWATFRLEGTKLYITNSDDSHYQLADPNYVLGTPFEAKFIVGNKLIRAYYNGALVASINASKLKGAYFKAGAYTQANCTNSSPCSATNYGETQIHSITVSHIS